MLVEGSDTAGQCAGNDARVIPDSLRQHVENLGHWSSGVLLLPAPTQEEARA
jgi:hypothetical protein